MSATGYTVLPALVRACHRNWVEAVGSIASDLPSGTVRRQAGTTIVQSGLAITAFNCAFVLDPVPTLNGTEEAVAGVLADQGQPWCLIATEENRAAIEPLASALGLQPTERMPGMIWRPLPEPPPSTPEELRIRRVSRPNDVREFGRTMMEGFDAPPHLMDLWAEAVVARGSAARGDRSLYLGFVRNRPVCTAVRFTTERIAGIYGVSTIPEFRRRGYGAAITRHAVFDGFEAGCALSYLQSSEMGRALYESLGYRSFEEYTLWLPEEPARVENVA